MIGLTIDPGVNNGVCLWSADDTGFKVLELHQFLGGADELDVWLDIHVSMDGQVHFDGVRLDALVVEKFTPRDNEGFSLTLEACEPLVGEGVLIAHKLKPFISWAQPSQQYFMGSPTLPLAEKKRLAKEFLERHNILPKGKEFNYKDANDAISATLHSIAYLRRIRHMPTMLQLFGPSK